MSSKEDDKKLQEAFDDLYRYVLIMGLKFNWQMIAATLVSIGLRIYKTVLDEEGYKRMTKTISDSYDEIEKFEDTTVRIYKQEWNAICRRQCYQVYL